MIKITMGLVALTLLTSPMQAQDKLFSLEDLNFGGTNYRKMQPQNMWLTWWGDQLMYQDAEEGGTIDAKGNKKVLFTLDEVNYLMTATYDNDKRVIHSAMNAEYPYPDQPLVLLKNANFQLLYNFKTKKVEEKIGWVQTLFPGSIIEWSPVSRALAYKVNNQLFVRIDEKEQQLTTDGSREADSSGAQTASGWHSTAWTRAWSLTIPRWISSPVKPHTSPTNTPWPV